MDARNPLDSVIEDLAAPESKLEQVSASLDSLAYLPVEYWKQFQQPKWTDDEGNPVSVYSAMHQELAWIRRILIHGEDSRERLIRNDAARKEAQDLYAQNQAKLIKNVGTYSMMRLGFGVVQTAILGGILVAVLMS